MCEQCQASKAVLIYKRKALCGNCAYPNEAEAFAVSDYQTCFGNLNDGNVRMGDVSRINYRAFNSGGGKE